MKKYAYLILLAVLVIACGKAEEAKQEAPKTADTTTQAQAFIAQGTEYLNNQDIPNAIASFDSAIKADPRNGDNYMFLGQVYLRLRNYDKAVDTFNAGTRADPNNGEMYYFLAVANAVRLNLVKGAESTMYRDQGVAAAKRSVEIFIQQQDETKFKQAVALLKSLQDGGDIGKVPEGDGIPEGAVVR